MEQRVRKLNHSGVRPGGPYVLYWLRYNRRAEANHALRFAASLANRLELPLRVFEGLASGCPSANRRRHTFLLEGVAGTAARLRKLGIGYTFHLEQRPPEMEAALSGILRNAAAVVTDDYPETLSGPPPVFEIEAWAVDSSCVVPAACIDKRSYAAYSIRPKIHKLLPQFLKPVEPVRVERRFPRQEGPRPATADLASCANRPHEPHPVFSEKILASWHYHEQGLHKEKLDIETFRLLTVTTTRLRADNLCRMTASLPTSVLPERARKYYLYTPLQALGDGTQIFGSVYHSAQDPPVAKPLIPAPPPQT